jgi:hypothetical protein
MQIFVRFSKVDVNILNFAKAETAKLIASFGITSAEDPLSAKHQRITRTNDAQF